MKELLPTRLEPMARAGDAPPDTPQPRRRRESRSRPRVEAGALPEADGDEDPQHELDTTA